MFGLIWATLALGSSTWDFESGPEGFSSETGLQFEWGSFAGVPPPNGSDCCGWATQLSGHYLNDAADSLLFPALSLDAASRPVLLLEHWFTTEDGAAADAGWVEALYEGSWIRLEPVYGYPAEWGFSGFSETWQTDAFDLSGLGTAPQLRLRFVAGDRISYPGWHINKIEISNGDPIDPIIFDVFGPSDTTDVDGPYTVHASAMDDLTYPDVSLYWSIDGGPTESVSMTALGDSHFAGEITGQPSGTVVTWWLTASDGINTTRHPSEESADFRVALPAPSDLSAAGLYGDDRIAAFSIDMSWTAPDTTRSIREFEILRDGVRIQQSDTTEATVDLTAGEQIFTVQARFDTSYGVMAGDPSNPLRVSAAIPEVTSIEPNHGWPGERIRVDLVGMNLYLDPDTLTLDAGPDIRVESLDVIDADHARVILEIDDDAQPSTGTLTLTTGETVQVSSPTFEVLSSDNQPKILAARPPYVRQSAETTIFVDLANNPNSGPDVPSVDMGDGVFVQDVTRRSTGIDVKVIVAATAPVGDHPITVDEGNRILTGVALEVRDNRPPAQNNCSQAPRESETWWYLILMGLARRRRPPQEAHNQK